MSAGRALLARWQVPEDRVGELLPWFDARPAVPALLRSVPWGDEQDAHCWRWRFEAEPTLPALERLRPCFAELWFPIEAGVSRSDAYRQATRNGVRAQDARELELDAPERLLLELMPTPAGSLLTLSSDSRDDFVRLTRAFTARSEPAEIPSRLDAVLVPAVVDWRRFERERQRWTQARMERGLDDSPGVFLRHRESYVDRLALLWRQESSTGPEALARARLVASYLLLRRFRRVQRRLLDRLLVDFHALVTTHGSYDAGRARALLEREDGARPAASDSDSILERAERETLVRLERLAAELGSRLDRPEMLAHALLALAELSWAEVLEGAIEKQVCDRLDRVEPLQRGLAPLESRFLAQAGAEALSAILQQAEETVAGRLPEKTLRQLQVALDELLSNVVKYAYDREAPGEVLVSLRLGARSVTLVVEDRGRPFDPTELEAPATDQPLEERPIGGLGLHLVKSFSRRLAYRRQGERNVLELELGWEQDEAPPAGDA